MGMFRGSADYSRLDLLSKYQTVFEMTTFLYQDYKAGFEEKILKRFNQKMTEEQLQVEGIVFCSWISLEVMRELFTNECKT